MSIVPYAITALAGVMNAIHSGTNAQLTQSLGRPWWAAVIVCLVSAAVVLAGVAVTREGLPGWDAFAGTPWWAWVGTAIAAVPVITTLLYAGRLGGAAFNGLVVTLTIVTSIVLDHYGLLGFKAHPATAWRIVGAGVMLGGLGLVCAF